MASYAYPRGKALFASGGNWASEDQAYAVALVTADYVPKPGHRFLSDVEGELKGGGYKRQPLTGRQVVVDEQRGCVDCLAEPVTFKGLSSTQAYRWVVIHRVGKSDDKSELVCAIDMQRVDLNRVTAHTVRWEKNGRAFSLA